MKHAIHGLKAGIKAVFSVRQSAAWTDFNYSTNHVPLPTFTRNTNTATDPAGEKSPHDAKELKDYLNSLTPEARAKFWSGN